MKEDIVRVLPDGTLVLSEELKESFADVLTFWATQEDDFILLMPLDRKGEETPTTAQALTKLREMTAQADETTRTPEEVIEKLRAIRRRIWAEEYRPRHAKALERFYAAHPDRRPR
jgi:negative regulator of replication initiation